MTINNPMEAYKRLRSQNHPDKGGDADKFDEVQKAYDEAQRELST